MSWDQHSRYGMIIRRLWSFGAGLAWIVRSSGGATPMGSRMLPAWEMPRADAARLAGMDRQTLRDAVVRYNAKGLEGLHDRPKGSSPRRLTADEEAALGGVSSSPGRSLSATGFAPGPGPICAAGWRSAIAKTYHPSSMTRVIYGGWDYPARRRARATREGTPKRRSASKKGASRHPEGDRRGASRQAPTAVVSG